MMSALDGYLCRARTELRDAISALRRACSCCTNTKSQEGDIQIGSLLSEHWFSLYPKLPYSSLGYETYRPALAFSSELQTGH